MTDETTQTNSTEQQPEQTQEQPTTENQQSTQENQPPKSGATTFYKEQATTYKTQLEKANARINELAHKIEESTFKSMQEKEQHKELADAYKEKYEAEKRRVEDFSQFVTQDKKMSAIKQEAIKQGISHDALKYLDMEGFDTVQVETTSSGNFNVMGVLEAVEAYKLENKLLFTDNRPPTINNSLPQNTSSQNMTADQILQLQSKNPKEYQRIMMERLAKASRRQ